MFGEIRSFFALRPAGVDAALLFGSHARGSTHASSDVDIGVLFDARVFSTRAERAAEAERLTTALMSATRQNAVDVVVLNDAPPELAVAVLDSGQIAFCSNQAAMHGFVRTARLRLADLRPFLTRMRQLKLEALAR